MGRRTKAGVLAACLVLVACASSEAEEEEATTESALGADGFACFRPESPSRLNGGYSCSGSPNLVFSTLCPEGTAKSWHRDIDATAPDMTMAVIAPHGGEVERGTDEIAWGIAADLRLPHYVFVAHAEKSCRNKYGGDRPTNALHITSTHFNDERAEALMRSVNRGLGIHGHARSNKICVGGRTPALRDAFEAAWNAKAKALSPSRTPAVIATEDDECSGITGTSKWNISNRSSTGAGLQLELSREARDELVASLRGDRRYWNAFRDAVRAACRVSIAGVSGCR